jgi:hypothetical protein
MLSQTASAGFALSCVSTMPSVEKSGRIEPGGCAIDARSRSVNVSWKSAVA